MRTLPTSLPAALLAGALSLGVTLTSLPAAAQDAFATEQIVNAGINLGWVDGIAASGGITAANAAEVGADLANASAHVSALVGRIATPPYDRRGFVRANEMIQSLANQIGGLGPPAVRNRIAQIMRQLRSSLDVYLDARTSRVTSAPTCEGATLAVGFAFGQGHTAIQRGNTTFERQARGSFQAAIRTGEGASRRLACTFDAAALRALPNQSSPTPATYAVSLPVLQAAASPGAAGGAGGGGVAPGVPTATAPLPGTWRGSGWGTVVLRAVNGRLEGSYDATFGSQPGRIVLERVSGQWRGTWSDPAVGRNGRLYDITVSADGRTISGLSDVTNVGSRGRRFSDARFSWSFVR